MFVLDEGERIQRQLAKMAAIAARADIIVADGGSTDGGVSAETCRRAGVRTLLIKRESGRLGTQMRMAFAYALAQGYAGVVVVDGNDKDDVVGGLERFLAKLEDGFDHVQGSRFLPGGGHARTPWLRWLGVRLVHAPLLSLHAGVRYTDTTNGFRAYSRRLLEDPRVAPLRAEFTGYELHYHLALEAPRLGYRVIEVPVVRVYPASGKVPTKIHSLRAQLGVLARLAEVIGGRYRLPDPAPRASLLERVLLAFGRLALQTSQPDRTVGAQRSQRVKTWLGVALLAALVAAAVLLACGAYRTASPRLARAGHDGACSASQADGRELPAWCALRSRGALVLGADAFESSALTVETWFRAPHGDAPTVMVDALTVEGQPVLRLEKNSQARLRVGTPNVDGSWGRALDGKHMRIRDAAWHHVVATVDWKRGRLASYLDGVPMALGDVEPGPPAGHTLATLRFMSDGSEVGAVRIYDRYLEPMQVRASFEGWAALLPERLALALLGTAALAALVVLSSLGFVRARCASAALIVAMTFALHASFAANALAIAERAEFASFQRDSELLVLSGLAGSRPQDYFTSAGGFGLGNTAAGSARAVYGGLPLDALDLHAQRLTPYVSQVGLQSVLLGALRPLGSLFGRWDISFLHEVSGLLTAFSAALLAWGLGRAVSAPFGAAVFLALLMGKWLTLFARNLYWVPWSWLLPSLCVVYGLSHGRWGLRRVALMGAGVMATVALKSAMGYEYLSTVLLSAGAMVWAVRAPPGISGGLSMLRRSALFVYVGACGVIGFVATLCLHASARGHGSIGAGLEAIYEKDVLRRTLGGDPARFAPVYADSFRATIRQVVAIYLDGEYVSGLRISSLIVCFVCFSFAWWVRARRDVAVTSDDLRARELWWFTVCALAASLSWTVLAKSHSFIHTHINHVIWTLFFVPALFGWVAHMIVPARR